MNSGFCAFLRCVSKKKCSKFVFSLIFCPVFIFIFFVCFSGCGKSSKSADPKSGEKIKIIATIFPIYDLANQVAKNSVDLKMLLPPGVDAHSFEPTPETVKLVENCNVLIYLGSDVDLWVEKILSSFDENKKNRIRTINLMQLLGYSPNQKSSIDPHVWTSFQTMAKMARILESNLAQIDSKNSSTYSENSAAFISKLNELEKEYWRTINESKHKTLVFADKFPFKHFIQEFNLEVLTPFANCSSKAEALSSKVSQIINFIKQNNISTVLKADFSECGLAESVANETGAKVKVLHSCHNVSADDFSANKTYLDFMCENLETLKEALN